MTCSEKNDFLRTPSEKWPTITEENNEVLLLVSNLLLLNIATCLILSRLKSRVGS